MMSRRFCKMRFSRRGTFRFVGKRRPRTQAPSDCGIHISLIVTLVAAPVNTSWKSVSVPFRSPVPPGRNDGVE